jgi:tetratricopeptide (TPR) repeat protein
MAVGFCVWYAALFARLPAQSQCTNCYALVIGITGYPRFDPDKRLQYADADAADFAAFLQSREGGGIPRNHIYFLRNEGATKDAILDSLEALKRADNRSGGRGLVFVFFAGHGVRDHQQAYLMPYDGRQDLARSRGIPMTEFVRELDGISSSVIFFIDACYAGAAFGSGLSRDAGENATSDLSDIWQRQLRNQDALRMGMVSADATQRAFEDPEYRHGLFTWFLMKGLRGAADIAPQNGLVTAGELYQYVLSNVERRSIERDSAYQSPVKLPGFKAEFVLATLRPEIRVDRSALLTAAEQGQRLFRDAFAAGEAGRYADAAALYRRVLALDPTDSRSTNNLGVAVEALGDTAEATRLFRVAVRLDPRNAEAHSNLGGELIRLRQLDSAEKELSEAIRLRPGYVNAHTLLGNAMFYRGDIDSAIAEYRESIRLNKDPLAYYNLGNTWDSLGELDEAIAAYDAALRLRPGYDGAQIRLDQDLAKRSTLQRELDSLRTLARSDPTHNSLLVNRLHERAFQFEEAYSVIVDRYQRDTSNIGMMVELTEAAFTTGRFESAQQWIAHLQSRPSVPIRYQIVLRALEIATLHALGKSYLVEERKSALASLIAAQPDAFNLNWVFAGTKHFIRNDGRLTPYRRWLLKLLTALEAGKRDAILARLPRTAVGAHLDWIKCENDSWCGANVVNVDHHHFDGLEGVYVVWYGGASPATLMVGQGRIREAIRALRANVTVQAYAGQALYVTWAAVPRAQRDGVEKFLVDRLAPRLGSSFPLRFAVAANLPW